MCLKAVKNGIFHQSLFFIQLMWWFTPKMQALTFHPKPSSNVVTTPIPCNSHAGDNSVLCHMKFWQTGPAVAVRRQSTTPSECNADKAQTQNNSVFVDLLETINSIQMTVSCRYKPDVENSSAQFNLSPVWLIQAQQQSSGRKRGCIVLIILSYETCSHQARHAFLPVPSPYMVHLW